MENDDSTPGRFRSHPGAARTVTDCHDHPTAMTEHRNVPVVGNPKPASRTRAAAEAVAATIDGTNATIDLAEHGEALLQWGLPVVNELKAQVLDATALIVASPTYKASYTGLLKLFLDQF